VRVFIQIVEIKEGNKSTHNCCLDQSWEEACDRQKSISAVNVLNCLLWVHKVVLQGQELIPRIKSNVLPHLINYKDFLKSMNMYVHD